MAMLFQNGLAWMGVALVGIVVFLVLGFTIDIRFFIVALIWIFLILPLMTAFLYFYYGLMPLTALNATLHKIIFAEDKVRVVILNRIEEEGISMANNPKNPVEEPSSAEEKSFIADKNSFMGFRGNSDCLILQFRKLGWLGIPLESLQSPEDLKRIISFFS